MKKAILFLMVLFPLFLSSQNSNDTIITKQQYIETVKRVKNLEKRVNTDKAVLKKAETSLDISEKYSKSADKSLNLILNILKIFGILFAILFSIMGIGGLGGIIGVIKYLKKFKENSEKYIRNEVSKILDKKEKTILELFDKHEKEKGLLTTSQILILNKSNTDINEYVLKILKNFNNFNKRDIVEDLTTYDCNDIKNKNFDAVIFDNTNTIRYEENWDFDEKKNKDKLIEIASIVCKQNTAFIFFGKEDGGFAKAIPEYSHLISFSKNPATLFFNLMNLLEFRRLLLM